MKTDVDNFFLGLTQAIKQEPARYAGNPDAAVAIVGLQPDVGEPAPFSGPTTCLVKAALMKLSVPPQQVYLTYLRKTQQGIDDKGWSLYAWQEMLALNPRVLILLGPEVFTAMFRVQRPNVEDLRHIQFGHDEWPELSFFVTYSIGDVAANGYEGETYERWVQDFRAVFQSNRPYFSKQEVLP